LCIGDTGLDGTVLLPKPVSQALPGGIYEIYKHLIATPPRTAWIVATGACTNVALLLSAHPDIADHIAGVSLMGGAIGFGFTDAPMGTLEDRKKHPDKQTPFGEDYYQECEPGKTTPFGNWTPWAEFNIFVSAR
jgi:uridine nucleosidase